MWLSYVFTGIIIVASLLIQGHSSFDVIRVGGVKPDLLFISILFFGYNFGSFYGEITGFIGGLFQDSISNSPLGLLALPKVLIGYFIGVLGRDLFQQNFVVIALLVFGASLVKGILTLILCWIFQDASFSDITSIILPESFYNALLSPFLFKLFDRLFDAS